MDFDLGDLSPEELKAVENLVNKIKKKKSSKKPSKKRKDIDKSGSEIIVEKSAGRKEPRKKIIIDENEEIPKKSRGRGRTKPKASRKGKSKGRKGKMAKTESVQISNSHEKFYSQDESPSAKRKDQRIDSKLWGDNKPTKRGDTRNKPVEVQCKVCELYYDVPPSIVLVDPDTKEDIYTCDSCLGK